MKFLGSITLFLFFTITVFAQKNITLSGTVFDKADNHPVLAASVELLNSKDSTLVGGAVSNGAGEFSIKNLSKGDYIIKITYLGYIPFHQPVTLTENQTSFQAGKLYLQADDILLKETIVEGKRPDVIVKNDTIEYDAASYKTTENAVVEDLLKKLPGVEVDKEGKITVNGKEVKKFLVDGKDFFSDDPQVASKNLPAEMVEKLQVVDRKSDMARMTGFNDGEEETIINLTIRPGMKQGTMGNVLAGAGADLQNDNDLRYQAGAFLNHMKNSNRYTLIVGTNNNNNMGAGDLGANQFGGMRMRRGGGGGGITESTNLMLSLNREISPVLSLNGDIRYNGSNRLSASKVEQVTLSRDRPQFDKTFTNNDYSSNNLGVNFTLEWKPDTMNTLIFRPNLGFNNSHSDELEIDSSYNYNDMSRMYNTRSDSENKGSGYNLNGTLDYAHKFSKPGRVFSINARGSYNNSYSKEKTLTDVDKYIEYNLTDLNQRFENDNNTNNYRAVVSWVEPLGRNNFLQALYRISQYDTKSINSTYNMEDLANYGELATRDNSLSRSTMRNSLEQRFGLSFKAVRPKYNYTVGLNVDPSNSINETYQPNQDYLLILPNSYDSRLANLMGDTLISSIKQEVINFSPVVNFNYIFGQRTNLRIDYEGETNQPSANQLRDYIDKSRPTNWVKGNPQLKPGYSSNLRARFNKYVAETQLMYNVDVNGGFSTNDITSVTQLLDTVRLTTYENINGNWNTQIRGMFNMPLKNKRFTIGSFLRLAYSNQNSLIYEKRDTLENTQKNFSIMDNFNINYRSDLFDVGMNVSANYGNISNSVRPENNQNTLSLGIGGYTTWRLPHKFTIDSDINFTRRSGFASGYNIPETIWNAAVTKQLFNKKFGTLALKLQIYDILQDRNSISSATTTNGFRTSEFNTIPGYFMLSVIYKFTAFPKSSSATEEDLQGGRRWGGPNGPGPGGNRPGPPPGGAF